MNLSEILQDVKERSKRMGFLPFTYFFRPEDRLLDENRQRAYELLDQTHGNFDHAIALAEKEEEE